MVETDVRGAGPSEDHDPHSARRPSFLSKAFDRLLATFGIMAGFAFVLLALAISTDVVLRNLGIVSLPWLLEVSEYVLYAATFLAAPWVLGEGRHVRVDVFLECLSPRARHAAAWLGESIGLAVCAILGWYSGRVTLDAFTRGELVFKELVFPEWWLLIILPISFAMMVIEFARRIHSLWRGEGELRQGAPADGL